MGSRVELQVFCPRWLPTCLRVDCFEFAKCCEWMRVAVNEAVHKDLNILSPIFVWLVNSSSERSCLILFFFQNRIICPQELSSKNRDSPLVVHESRLPLYVRAFSPDGLPHKKMYFCWVSMQFRIEPLLVRTICAGCWSRKVVSLHKPC